jgi:DNA-binding MarR family transcriptional regulator
MSWEQYVMTQVSEARHRRENSFGFLVQTLAKRMDVRMTAELKKYDVDIKIFASLMFLSERDGVNQREIGNMLNFPEYYTSRNIDTLVKTGFAERRADPKSRRSFLIFLTEEGKAKAKEIAPVVKKVNDTVLVNLSKEERKIAVSLLQKVAGIDQYSKEIE